MLKIKYFVLVILILSANSFVFSQITNDLIINVPGRNTISLDGEWNIIIDRYNNGYYDYRQKPTAEGYALNQKPISKSDRIEYDFDKSPTLKVPGDWNSQMKELYYYEGTVWYKKSFNYSIKQGKRLFLYFGAVNYQAIVFLNGELIGEHIGGFTPFNIEITNKVKDDENFIVVFVNNERKKEGVPTLKTDWWNYGGITRSVKLIETPETFIKDYFIQLKKGSQNEIEGWVKLNGVSKDQDVTIEIPEMNSTSKLRTDENGYAKIYMKIDVELWSPENPKLYEVNISSETDFVKDKVGFRTIEVACQDILLNGKSIFLRGMSVHEEAPIRTGRSYSEEDAKTTLTWAKELGLNFLRLAHYPHNETIVRMADEMGILLWSEIPVYWVIDFENIKTLNNAINQLSENINRDKNRACIIIWSMANETPISEARNQFLIKLVEQTHKLDNTRLISAALEKDYPEDYLTPHVNDPFGKYLDILSFNEYVGWYDGLPEKCEKVNWVIEYDKPVIISEFGAGAKQGFYGEKEERWTEDYQEDLYIKTLGMIDKIENLRGITPWILMDFRSPNRVLPEIQDGFNRKGIISEDGKKKKAYYVLKDWFTIKAEEYK
ncbi:glycoside hydrolase family 2 protein [Bacteroidota bacterium]